MLYDRYQQMDGDLGIVIEPETLPKDIYPYAKVEDEEESNVQSGVRGSCSTFTSRTELRHNSDISDIQVYINWF